MTHPYTLKQKHPLSLRSPKGCGNPFFFSQDSVENRNQKSTDCHVAALLAMTKILKEALIKSARADSGRFCFRKKDGKSRNTVCISGFSACISGAKDPLLSRRRFIQSFLKCIRMESRPSPAWITQIKEEDSLLCGILLLDFLFYPAIVWMLPRFSIQNLAQSLAALYPPSKPIINPPASA